MTAVMSPRMDGAIESNRVASHHLSSASFRHSAAVAPLLGALDSFVAVAPIPPFLRSDRWVPARSSASERPFKCFRNGCSSRSGIGVQVAPVRNETRARWLPPSACPHAHRLPAPRLSPRRTAGEAWVRGAASLRLRLRVARRRGELRRGARHCRDRSSEPRRASCQRRARPSGVGPKGVLRLQVLLASIGVVSCFNFDTGHPCGDECDQSCSGFAFEVTVPDHRADDIASVQPMARADLPLRESRRRCTRSTRMG